MESLIGNKEEFAIQVCTPLSSRSKIGLWLGGSLIGNCREEEYLKGVYSQLLRLNTIKELKMNIIPFSTININTLIEDEDKYKQIVLNIGESFDDFIIRVLGDKDYICFYWKLVDKPFFKYENLIVPNSWVVKWDDYNLVLEEFNNRIYCL